MISVTGAPSPERSHKSDPRTATLPRSLGTVPGPLILAVSSSQAPFLVLGSATDLVTDPKMREGPPNRHAWMEGGVRHSTSFSSLTRDSSPFMPLLIWELRSSLIPMVAWGSRAGVANPPILGSVACRFHSLLISLPALGTTWGVARNEACLPVSRDGAKGNAWGT